MKNTVKKILSSILAVVFIFSAVPSESLIEIFENTGFNFSGIIAAAADTDFKYTLLSNGKSYGISAGNTKLSGAVTLPSSYNGKSVTSINDGGFKNCKNITSITLPNTITEIGHNAFSDCTSLTSIRLSDKLQTLKYTTFKGCSSLTSVTLPGSLTSVSFYTFDDCPSLSSITVTSGSGNYSSQDGVLFNRDKTELVRFPEGKSGTYTIPSSVSSISGFAFKNCEKLTSVTIPETIKTIGKNCFENCKALSSVKILNGVQYIYGYAFSSCYNLTTVSIPASVKSIGDNTFYGCLKLSSVNVDSANKYYSSKDGVLFDLNKTKLIKYPATKSGSYNIPDTVSNIAPYAFEYAADLTSVNIPSSVINIGDFAFSNCTKLSSINVSPENFIYLSQDGVLFNSTGSELLYCPCGKSGAYTIPATVTSIVPSAFACCKKLTSVKIPDGVTSIKDETFKECRNLTAISIPDSVKSIGTNAFQYCNSLTIYAKSGSSTEKYAKDNKINFKAFLTSSVIPKLSSISQTSKGVTIKWSGVSLAESYTLYRKSGSSGYKALKTLTGKSYTDTTVKGGTKYTYTVKASNFGSNSGYNKTGISILFLSAPTVKLADKSGYVSVSWNKITSAKGYVIYKKTGSGSYKKLKTVTSGSTLSYSDKSVKSGTKYAYYVKAYNGSTYSGYKTAVTILYLSAPTLKVSKSSKYKLYLKWSKITGAKQYELQYRKTGSSTWKTAGITKSTACGVNFKGKYDWRIRSINGSTKSAFSSTLKTKV